MTEKLPGLISRDALPIVIHDDFGHPLRKILELEFNCDVGGVGIQAVPDQLRKRMHRFGAGLPRHEIFFYLDLNVLNSSDGSTTIR